MKIAFASSDGSLVDQHFGLTQAFYLWDIDAQQARSVSKVDCSAGGDDPEDRIVARAAALDGCTLVYSLQIGGPAAAKLAARHIHPMKTTNPTPIAELVNRLQGALQSRPPPWLCRAMGIPPKVLMSIGIDEDDSGLAQ
jgi:nitrogen fixation protein NifX